MAASGSTAPVLFRLAFCPAPCPVRGHGRVVAGMAPWHTRRTVQLGTLAAPRFRGRLADDRIRTFMNNPYFVPLTDACWPSNYVSSPGTCERPDSV